MSEPERPSTAEGWPHSPVAEPWDDRARLGYEAYMSTPNMVIVLDERRHIGAINPAGETLTGLAYEEVAGRHLSVLLAPGTVDTGLAQIERAAAGDVHETDVAFVSPWTRDEDPGRVVVGIGAAPLFLDGAGRSGAERSGHRGPPPPRARAR